MMIFCYTLLAVGCLFGLFLLWVAFQAEKAEYEERGAVERYGKAQNRELSRAETAGIPANQVGQPMEKWLKQGC